MSSPVVKYSLLALLSLFLGFTVIALAERVSPQPRFGLGVAFASVLFFAILQTAFSSASARGNDKPKRFPREEEPLIGCPTCHTQMHLLGTNGSQGETRLYLWTCERDHGWSRQGENPADETYPWQACNATEMVGVFFG